MARRYVQVQMSSKITDSRLWKLNRALCKRDRLITGARIDHRRPQTILKLGRDSPSWNVNKHLT